MLNAIDKYFVFSLKKSQKPDAGKAANVSNQKAAQAKNNSNSNAKQLNSKAVTINEKDNFIDVTDAHETEAAREEDLLANIAFCLQKIMETHTETTNTDFDLIIDTILLLWRKCRAAFEKWQTGSEENFRWVVKLDNKWLYVLNIVHEAMCRFGFTTVDLQLFMHCSVRLGLAYESLAIVWSKKSASSQLQETTEGGSGCIEKCLEKYSPPTNARDNYVKAK